MHGENEQKRPPEIIMKIYVLYEPINQIEDSSHVLKLS